MSMLLLTMGPALGLVMDTSYPRVGDPGLLSFRAVGAVGTVVWRLVASDLPGEWDAALSVSDDIATLSTATAITAGSYAVTVQVADQARTVVARTFVVTVLPQVNWAWATTVPYPYFFGDAVAAPVVTLVSAEIRSLLIDTATTDPLAVTATLVSAEIRNPIAYAETVEPLTVDATLVSAEIRDPVVRADTAEPLTVAATLTSASIDVVLVTTQTTEPLTVAATLVSAEIATP